MTDLTAEGTVRALFDALDAHDFARAAGPIAEDCHWTSIATGTVHIGPGPIIAGLREFVMAFPDWHVAIERITAAGDLVYVEWETNGTFERPFRGEPANGRRFHRRGCAVAEIRAGRIVRYRDYYDRMSLLQQLDLMHLTSSASRG